MNFNEMKNNYKIHQHRRDLSMKQIIQLALAIVFLSVTTIYANSNTYNQALPDDPKQKDINIEDFTVVHLIENEIQIIKEENIVIDLEMHRERERFKQLVSRGDDRGLFTATAYDLSVASCGKSESHPAFGITANGTSLKGHTLESARAIAVDPKFIKLGSKVYIEFLDEAYEHLSGIFYAVDTGGAIKGKKVDIFFGSDNVKEEVKQFGRRKVKLTVIKE